MKIFVDEDTGSSIAKALISVGVEVSYISNKSRFKCGTPDEEWLPFAGSRGLLVLSRNIGMMRNENQRSLIVAEKVGIVFLPQDLSPLELLRLVLKKWDWLVGTNRTESRPFAYRLSPKGKATRLPLVAAASSSRTPLLPT